MVIFFVVLGILLLLTLAAYIISLCKGQTTIVKSTVVSGPVKVEADQTYYLPAHSMMIKATALVQVAKSADKVIQGGTLLQLTLEPAVTIEPDTSALVTLRYKGDWFSNDAIELGTTAKGLLENISVVAEDRLTQIVAQITGAVEQPAARAAEARGLLRRPKDILVTEIVEYTRTFSIGVREAGQGEISRPWVLPFKGSVAPGVEPIDATITFRCKTNKTTPPSLNGLKFDGLLTRPLVEQTWEATAEGLRDLVSFTCLVPNRYSVVKVPMRRSYFIRREQQPKFSDGLLLQNKIVKPSENQPPAPATTTASKSHPTDFFQGLHLDKIK